MKKQLGARFLRVLLFVALMCGMSATTGCITGREFRAAAGPGVKTGVSAILDGVLDGLFAIIEPEAPTN